VLEGIETTLPLFRVLALNGQMQYGANDIHCLEHLKDAPPDLAASESAPGRGLDEGERRGDGFAALVVGKDHGANFAAAPIFEREFPPRSRRICRNKNIEKPISEIAYTVNLSPVCNRPVADVGALKGHAKLL
jgi:hypothetical protein